MDSGCSTIFIFCAKFLIYLMYLKGSCLQEYRCSIRVRFMSFLGIITQKGNDWLGNNSQITFVLVETIGAGSPGDTKSAGSFETLPFVCSMAKFMSLRISFSYANPLSGNSKSSLSQSVDCVSGFAPAMN